MGATVLVVEDNDVNLYLMTYLLESFGHRTVTARDGEEGLARVADGGIDLVVCDIHLPKLDGYEFARRIRRDPVRARLPLVAVTALAMAGDRDKILAAGFDGYISKPVASDAFVGQVDAFLPVVSRSSATAAPSTLEPARVAEHRTISSAHILAVDDWPANLDVLCGVLEPFGYRVSTAGSMVGALARARAEPPDLLIADFHMPNGDGYDLLAAVRADPQLKAIPFVLISSTTQDDRERVTAIARGAKKFILRPIEPETLLSEIEECLPKT